MTDAQINRLVAEKICGWRIEKCGINKEFPFAVHSPTSEHWAYLYRTEENAWQKAPRYTTDRNAIAEMEEAIAKTPKWLDYIHALADILEIQKHQENYVFMGEAFRLRRADPRQCCEAALRAFGLWEE